MKVTVFKYIKITTLLAVFCLTSCNIKDDLSDCPGYFLLDYTAYSKDIIDDIDPESVVNVYVFDKSDLCSNILSFTYAELEKCNFEFKVPLNYLGCNVVVWHGNNCEEYNSEPMKVGNSLDEFYLRLNKSDANEFTHAPSLLWASMLEKVEFCASKTRHRIHMLRIHTEVNVALNIKQGDGSIVSADMSKYLINIKATADVYHRDYTVYEESCEVLYNNAEEVAKGEFTTYGHAGTLRLLEDGDCNLSLTNLDDSTGVTVGGTNKIDLIKYMLCSKAKADNVQTNQRFLDLNKVWNIELLVDKSYVATSITINGWTVWFDDAHLD